MREVSRRVGWSSESIVADQAAVGPVPERAVDAQVDPLLQKPDRAVAEQEVGTARMKARESPDELDRQGAGPHQRLYGVSEFCRIVGIGRIRDAAASWWDEQILHVAKT